jgi:hypothetical protein
MLVGAGSDTGLVLHRVLVLTSFVCCGLVILAFTMFARDQLAGASKHQQNELAAGQPTTPGTVPAATTHGQPRRFIDGAARDLTSPFRSIVQSSNPWVLHAMPTTLALLVYGLGLGYLARYSRGMS